MTQTAPTLAVRMDHGFYFAPLTTVRSRPLLGLGIHANAKPVAQALAAPVGSLLSSPIRRAPRGRTFHCSSTANCRSHDHLGSSGPLGSDRLAAGEKCEMLRANGDRANDDA